MKTTTKLASICRKYWLVRARFHEILDSPVSAHSSTAQAGKSSKSNKPSKSKKSSSSSDRGSESSHPVVPREQKTDDGRIFRDADLDQSSNTGGINKKKEPAVEKKSKRGIFRMFDNKR